MVYLARNTLDSLFNQFFYSLPTQEPKPPISIEVVSNGEGEYTGAKIQFAVAGFKKEDIEVYFEGRTLVIEGDNFKRENVSEKFLCSFSRKISIKENLDLENADISLEDGILSISLPVKDPKKNRTYILGGSE